MREPALSIIVVNQQSLEGIASSFELLDTLLQSQGITYEIIFLSENPANRAKITSFSDVYPISHFLLIDKKTTYLTSEIFTKTKYPVVCVLYQGITASISLIPVLLEKIRKGADIATISDQDDSFKGLLFFRIFVKFLHKFTFSPSSQIKIIRKEILERIPSDLSNPASEFSFFINARNAGYEIASHANTKGQYKTAGSPWNSLAFAAHAVKLKILRPPVIPFHPETVRKKGKGFHYKGKEYIHHSSLHHDNIAFFRLSGLQIFFFSDVFLGSWFGLMWNWHATIVAMLAGLTFLYFADLLFNFFLIYRSFAKPTEILISPVELKERDTKEWPRYTVFCPLYKEWQVVPQFVSAMSKLEYPKDKLQIMFLLEEDDTETINHIRAFQLPKYFEINIVPHSHPKTKPKACNYGLQFATGDYIVIYDAEDIPDPLQLKKIVNAFEHADPKIKCMQAKLNFYNPHQNLLTRVFTAEYSLWFDLVLTGLQSIHAPIPLGGTSNHFRKADLVYMKGWDSFNVTEDCDLGMRLVKQGYKTAMIDSVTLEEANAGLQNWFWQRTRWIKGYVQTYFLHMRKPSEFITKWNEPHVITFQLVVGGKVLSMLINPLMWIITISYFLFRAHVGTFIESFFPPIIFYMGVFSLVIGNFLYMYYYMIGCAKHGHDELVKYVFFVPLYWLGISIAAWVAVYKFIKEPHYWSKTKHGLHLKNQKTMDHAMEILGHELVDKTMKGGTISPA